MGSLGVEVDRVSGVGMAMCGQDSGEACLRDPKISVIKMSNSVFFVFCFLIFGCVGSLLLHAGLL